MNFVLFKVRQRTRFDHPIIVIINRSSTWANGWATATTEDIYVYVCKRIVLVQEHSRARSQTHASLFRWKNWLHHWEMAAKWMNMNIVAPEPTCNNFVRPKSTLINYLCANLGYEYGQSAVPTELRRSVFISSTLANDRFVHRIWLASCRRCMLCGREPFNGDWYVWPCHLRTLLIWNCPHILHEIQRSFANPVLV